MLRYLTHFRPDDFKLTQWLDKLHGLENTEQLTTLRNLEIPDFSDKAIKPVLSQRKRSGIEILSIMPIIDADLSQLDKLRERISNTPVLDRLAILAKFQGLETDISSQLSKLEDHLRVIKTGVHRLVNPYGHIGTSPVFPKGAGYTPNDPYFNQGHQNRQVIIPIKKTQPPLPHNGLFMRRNNTFGTKSTLGIKELIEQGVMIEQQNLRFDDFVAANTKGIPSPHPNNALAVSYGIAAIPAYQKRDEKATHYLEIALKTADVAPSKPSKTHNVQPVNGIFVIDTSESMGGDKLNMVKNSIIELFKRLRKDDILGIVEFNNRPGTVLEATPVERINHT